MDSGSITKGVAHAVYISGSPGAAFIPPSKANAEWLTNNQLRAGRGGICWTADLKDLYIGCEDTICH